MAPPRIDPVLPVIPNAPRRIDSNLKDRLTFLAEGNLTVHQLMSHTGDLLGAEWDDFTFENLDELDELLAGRMKAGNAEARIRWAIIRDVFVSFRASKN